MHLDDGFSHPFAAGLPLTCSRRALQKRQRRQRRVVRHRAVEITVINANTRHHRFSLFGISFLGLFLSSFCSQFWHFAAIARKIAIPVGNFQRPDGENGCHLNHMIKK